MDALETIGKPAGWGRAGSRLSVLLLKFRPRHPPLSPPIRRAPPRPWTPGFEHGDRGAGQRDVKTRPSPPRALRAASPTLIGLASIAGLHWLQGSWAVDLVLVVLILTVPGVVALRAARIPSSAVTQFPLYIPAAALLVVIAGGLLADLAGPPLGVTRPLHGDSTTYTVLGVSLVLWLLSIRAPATARFPWRELVSRSSLLLPLAIPALAGAGALMLSNGHGSAVAHIAGMVNVAALAFGLLMADRLRPSQLAVLLFGTALAAEWAFSLRSHEVIGFDITSEIHLAQHTQAAGIWHASHPGDAYGAMLSLTILPSVLTSLTGLSPLISFKVLYPVLTALLPVAVYLIGIRIMRRPYAVGAASLLIAQSYFFQQLPQIARQEVGLLFFAILVFALVDGQLRKRTRVTMVVASSVALVVSHYSTTYVALLVLVVALLARGAMVRATFPRGLTAGLVAAVLALGGGAALWYGAITGSTSNLSSFVSTLQTRGPDFLPAAKGGLLNRYLNGNNEQSVGASTFARLAVNDYRGRTYIHPLAAASEPRFALQSAAVPAPATRSHPVAHGLSVLSVVLAQLMLGFAALGAFLMLWRGAGSGVVRAVGVLALGTVAVLAAIRFSGTIAGAYNQTRALAQCLILLALPAAWLAQRLLTRQRVDGPQRFERRPRFDGRQRLVGPRRLLARVGKWRTLAAAALALAVSLQFAYHTSITSLVVGGQTGLNLAQSGEDFERQYMTPAELTAATWASTASRGQLLYADRYGQLRLWASSGAFAFTAVTPKTLDRDAWVFGTRTNVLLERARGMIGNYYAVYRWPDGFLGAHFDTVYSDGDSRVYHGVGR